MDNEDSKTPATLSDLESSLLYQVNALIIERDSAIEKRDDLITDHANQTDSAIEVTLNRAYASLVVALKDQVDGDLELQTASVIFAEFAEGLGKTGIWKNPFKSKYTVKVSHNNDVVMTITGVEAEDEEDAIEIVTEAISIDSPMRKGTLTYDDKNGDSDDSPELEEDDSSIDEDDFDLDYEAEQA